MIQERKAAPAVRDQIIKKPGTVVVGFVPDAVRELTDEEKRFRKRFRKSKGFPG